MLLVFCLILVISIALVLNAKVNDLLERLKDKDSVIEGLSEELIEVKQDRDHRLEQARELKAYVESRGERIQELEAINEDLSEALIG